jgi:guanylate kinase
MQGKLFVIAGPSGVGKTTLVNAVLQELVPAYAFERVITYTSKKPRLGEIEGQDYHFITDQEFEIKIAQGFFLEWSNVYGAYYGLPRSILSGLTQGTSYIVVLDRAGARAAALVVPEAILIWITVSSLQVLKERLIKRGRDTQEQIERRMALAAQELQQEYSEKLFRYTILNDNFQNSVKKLNTIIIDSLVARDTLK